MWVQQKARARAWLWALVKVALSEQRWEASRAMEWGLLWDLYSAVLSDRLWAGTWAKQSAQEREYRLEGQMAWELGLGSEDSMA